MKCFVLIALCVSVTGCHMTGKQRYKLEMAAIKAQAEQERTYTNFFV